MRLYKNSGKISIHASVKEATVSKSREEIQRNISIHASVKEATLYWSNLLDEIMISIHASVKEATVDHEPPDSDVAFQSTPP